MKDKAQSVEAVPPMLVAVSCQPILNAAPIQVGMDVVNKMRRVADWDLAVVVIHIIQYAAMFLSFQVIAQLHGAVRRTKSAALLRDPALALFLTLKLLEFQQVVVPVLMILPMLLYHCLKVLAAAVMNATETIVGGYYRYFLCFSCCTCLFNSFYCISTDPETVILQNTIHHKLLRDYHCAIMLMLFVKLTTIAMINLLKILAVAIKHW